MRTLLAISLFIFAASSVARADSSVFGWEISCHGKGGEKLHVTQQDDDAVMSSVGGLDIDETHMRADTYSNNANIITFINTDTTLKVLRFNPNGVGPGKAELKSPSYDGILGCEIGYVPFEDGPVCLTKESLINEACQ